MKTKTTQRKGKGKAISRTGWISERQFKKENFFCLHATKKQWFESCHIRVIVIRLDEYDATVERMARAMYGSMWPNYRSEWKQRDKTNWYKHVVCQLKAIGISRPKGGAR
jgi:succinate dehydrogenase/fumarate reductase flavoprotein subunit